VSGSLQRNELSGYPFIRQLAWLVKQQSPIHIFHELLLVNAKVPQMPSMTLGHSLAGLGATAADKEQNNQDNTQYRQNKSIFHNLFPFEARRSRIRKPLSSLQQPSSTDEVRYNRPDSHSQHLLYEVLNPMSTEKALQQPILPGF